MSRIFTSVVFLALAVPLAWLEWRYGLSYVARVYIKQESDASDIHWKPRIELQQSSNKRQLETQLDTARVAAAFNTHTEVSDLSDFMQATEATSLIVLQHGRLIYEEHFNEHLPGEAVATFSVSKSLFSMLLGRSAVDHLSGFMDASLEQYVPELLSKDPRFSAITHQHLINMRSGIAFDSDVSFPFFNEDEPLIYYADDLVKTLLAHPEIENEPGQFLYNDYNPNLLALAFARASGRSLPELLQSELWEPLGANFDAMWMTDYHGFPLIESGFAAAPVDLALVGQTMLDIGAGRSLFLPKAWHREITTVGEESPVYAVGEPVWHYRNGWWVMPRGTGAADYSAIGHLGQYVYVSPQNDLVIVRTGYGRAEWDDIDFIKLFYTTATELGNSL
ncbi:MAG: beta-lactamase family protein [Granulosicoccus sp.]|nr:beta-lactamase family protein [Granulosicoccus sp.]